MKKKFLSTIFVLIIFTSICACSIGVNVVKETSKEQNIDENEKIDQQHLEIKIEKEDISDIENGKTFQEIKYPVITCNNNLLQKLFDDTNKFFKESSEEFKYLNKNEIRNLIAETSDENSMYYHDIDASVNYQSQNYLSIVTNTQVFTMGAHGTTTINGYNYDILNKKLLKLDDFIKDKEELRKYLKDWISQQDDDMFFEWANETVDDYLDKDEFELQYYINEGVLTVVFQQYDIAPYAVGIIEVPIDKKLLKVDIN